MTSKFSGFEGQTSGTAWSVANSGGGSGDAFDSLTTTGSPTGAYDSAQAMHDTRSLHITGPTTSTWFPIWSTVSGSAAALRLYLYLVASSAAQDIVNVRSAAAAAATIGLTATTNRLQLKNAAGTALISFTNSLSLNTWYRIEMQVTKGTTTSNGTIAGAYYLGESATPVETAFNSGATVNAGTADITTARIGKLTSAPSFEAFLDSIGFTDAGATALGPYSTAATCSETITVGESSAAAMVTTGTATELVSVAESASAVTVTTGTATETVTVGDSTSAITVTLGTATELVTVAESAAGSTVTLGTASEPATVAESTVSSTVAGGSATGSEPITLGESAAALTISTGTATELVTVTETVTGLTTTLGTAAEPITITEAATAVTVTTGTADETLTVVEAADAVTVFAVTLVETITLAESMAIAHDLDLTISIGTPRGGAGRFVGAPQSGTGVVGSPRTTTPATIGRGV